MFYSHEAFFFLVELLELVLESPEFVFFSYHGAVVVDLLELALDCVDLVLHF